MKGGGDRMKGVGDRMSGSVSGGMDGREVDRVISRVSGGAPPGPHGDPGPAPARLGGFERIQ